MREGRTASLPRAGRASLPRAGRASLPRAGRAWPTRSVWARRVLREEQVKGGPQRGADFTQFF